MNYKHINLNELGGQNKIVKTGSRVAMFVPRLLGKLSVKLVLEPVTKITTGQTFEQVKDAAVDLTMQMQEKEAAELEEQISVGVQNLSDWKEDREYYIGNLAKYRDYQVSIEKLAQKRNKLISSPKRLLVAKNYFLVMKAFREKNKEVKANAKVMQQIVNEYKAKKDAYIAKHKEVESLQELLNKTVQDLNKIRAEIAAFEVAYNITSGEVVSKDNEVSVSQPVVSSSEPANVVNPVLPTDEESKIEVTQSIPESVKEQTELSKASLEQVNSFAYSTNDLQEKASDMPLFNAMSSIPVQTEADAKLLEQMGSFARQSMPVNTNNFESYGLEVEPSKSL